MERISGFISTLAQRVGQPLLHRLLAGVAVVPPLALGLWLVRPSGMALAVPLALALAAGLLGMGVGLLALRKLDVLGGEPAELAGTLQDALAGRPAPATSDAAPPPRQGALALAEQLRQGVSRVSDRLRPNAGAEEPLSLDDIIELVQSQNESFQMVQGAVLLTRAVLHNASIGMATANPSLDGSFQDVNQSLCALLDKDWFELVFLSPREFLHPEDLEAYDAAVQGVLAGHPEQASLSARIQRTGADWVWVQLDVSAVRDNGNVPRTLILQVIDLTARRAADRAKSEFVAVVSHELRTPLTSIIGSLGLVMVTMQNQMPPKLLKLIDSARRNSDRLLLLINDILDIDKIVSGGMSLELKQVPVRSLVEQAVESTQDYARRFSVGIEIRFEGSDVNLLVDPNRLTQVLFNLLSNAAKFSHEGGKVDVLVACTAERCRIAVRDHGNGIPPDHRDKLFTKFHQGDSSVTRKKGGTGLGLFISKSLVQLMHGQIGFDSVHGEGSTFWVELPTAAAQTALLDTVAAGPPAPPALPAPVQAPASPPAPVTAAAPAAELQAADHG